MNDNTEAVEKLEEIIYAFCADSEQDSAKAILADTKAERRARLDRIPAQVRPHVAAEAQRIWALR